MILNELDVNVSALKHRYPAGTHVLLFGVDGVPDGAKGEIDLIDDIGHIFIETETRFKNVVLRPDDMNVRFIRDCVNYDNIPSNSFAGLEDVEIDNEASGVRGYIEVTDFFVTLVPELAYCLSFDNDDWVNGNVFWNMETDEVTLTVCNDAAGVGAEHIEKEFVLTGQDKDWVVNAFNKDSFERFGLPTRKALEYMEKEDVVAEYLREYPLSPVEVISDMNWLNRVNVCCKLFDMDLTTKIVEGLAEQALIHPVTQVINVFNLNLSDDKKYLHFDVLVRRQEDAFKGVFRISDGKHDADMKLVSIDGVGADKSCPLVKHRWSAIESFVKDYVKFKGFDSKAASIDSVLANAKAKAELSQQLAGSRQPLAQHDKIEKGER